MLGLDHAILFARDLHGAALAYRRLGFDLTPRGGHPLMGTANHTIVFQRDYLELLTVVTPGPANERWSRALGRGDGLGGMVLATPDTRETYRALRERGVLAGAPIDFARPVARPAGTDDARFTISLLPDEDTPGLPAFVCQHHTPALVWLPEHQHHPNTARGIAGLTVVDPDPPRAASAYERLFGRARVHPHPGGMSVSIGTARLWLVTPAYADARLGTRGAPPGPLGITLVVGSLDAARRFLAAGSVPFAPFGRRSILIGLTWTHGVYLELVAA